MNNAAVKCWEYPDGSYEGHIVTCRRGDGGSVRVPDTASARAAARSGDTDADTRAQENLDRSVRRSKKALMRLIRTEQLTRLLTFTNGSPRGWESEQAALVHVMLFMRTHGQEHFGDTPYAAVCERGGVGGRIHVHVAVTAEHFIRYREVIAAWSRFMERRGHGSTANAHRFHAGKSIGNARLAARYLGKYIGKDLGESSLPPGAHRYRFAGANAPAPWAFDAPSLSTAARLLGFEPANLYHLEYLDEVTGSITTFGYLFDTGG